MTAEDVRARVIESYGLDGLAGDPELERIAQFAARLCGTPIGLVSLVEAERQHFIAREGLTVSETPRSTSFCAHAMAGEGTMIVPDATADPRFAENPLVTGEMGVRFYAGAPLISAEGAPLGALCVIDTTPRDGLSALQHEGLAVLAEAVMRRLANRRTEREANARSSGQTRAFREFSDLLPDVIWSADSDVTFDFFNARWREMTGTPPPQSTDDWRPAIHPDDAETTFAKWAESVAAGKLYQQEYRLRQADGSWRWMLSRGLPQLGPDGEVVRWYGSLTDIDEGHKLSESRELLARELSHRIKNIFAVVSGLVAIRARGRPEAAAFAEEIVAAIRALGRAHDFVRPGEGPREASLTGLLRELMAPYSTADSRVVVAGNDCHVGPRAATPLALVFHELATNSAKYGALSVEDASVAITIDRDADAGETVRIAWRETGGPPPGEPDAEGFGSRLVRMSVEGQLGGQIERRFPPTGLEVDLAIPVTAIAN